MKLPSNNPEQNVYFTYVCTIHDVKPTKDECSNTGKPNRLVNDPENSQEDNQTIKVDGSKALHELVEAHANEDVAIVGNYGHSINSVQYLPASSNEECENSENDDENSDGYDINPRLLKLTKMKWLTEGREGLPDSRSPSLSLSPASSSSQCSCRESDSNLGLRSSCGDKYLSTILRVDKEHNLFGLSNIAIVGSKASKKTCKKDEKPVFHQTAIVQICCSRGCRHRSKSDLPSSLLKYCTCNRTCQPPCCNCLTCGPSCVAPYICQTPFCSTCTIPYCPPKLKCSRSKCFIDRRCNYGVKLILKTKPKYEPVTVEVTPRAPCILAKPQMARPCYHCPPCLAPSNCFPYLMPCYWPARAGAPCTNPARCFHTPPCPPPRKPQSCIPIEAKCPPKCDLKDGKCTMPSCLGRVPALRKELQSKLSNSSLSVTSSRSTKSK